jgi:hypothetical protein
VNERAVDCRRGEKEGERHGPIAPSANRLGEADAWKRGNRVSGVQQPRRFGLCGLVHEERNRQESQDEDRDAEPDIPHSPAEMSDQHVRELWDECGSQTDPGERKAERETALLVEPCGDHFAIGGGVLSHGRHA